MRAVESNFEPEKNYNKDHSKRFVWWVGNVPGLKAALQRQRHLGHVLEIGSGPCPMTKIFLLLANSEDGSAACIAGVAGCAPTLAASSVTLVEPEAHRPDPDWQAALHFNRTALFLGELAEEPGGVVPVQDVCAVGAEDFFDGALSANPLPQYDTVVLWNILEHAYNAFAILDGVVRVLKPGGLLIFEERSVRLDAADQFFHPIRLTADFFQWFLRMHFHVEYNHFQLPMGEFESRFAKGTTFFIGRRK